MASISSSEIADGVTQQFVRTMGILRIALISGVTMFYLAIAAISSQGALKSGDAPDVAQIELLSMIHGAIALVAIGLGMVISKSMLRKERITETGSSAAVGQALAFYRSSTILLIAPIEGAALFGAVIVLLAGQGGLLEINPNYWLNAGSAVLLLLVGLATFPTRERIVNTVSAMLT